MLNFVKLIIVIRQKSKLSYGF